MMTVYKRGEVCTWYEFIFAGKRFAGVIRLIG
jgi:hypothetical protein